MWMIICIIVAVILLGWIGIGYVGFKTAICRGHELDINDREALKGTAWDQYYDEIQEGIVWISQQETEDIYQDIMNKMKMILSEEEIESCIHSIDKIKELFK